MIDDLLNALQNFKTNKMRTFLSLLGIVIGVTSVILITTLGASAQNAIFNNLNDFNFDLIYVMPRSRLIEFDEKLRQELLDKIPGIKNIFYSNPLGDLFIQREKFVEGLRETIGIEQGALESTRVNLNYGSFFSESDFFYGKQKVLISTTMAEFLFPEGRAIGKQLYLRSRQGDSAYLFTVAGVFENKRGAFGSNRYTAYVPRSLVLKRGNPRQSANEVSVQVYDASDAPEISRKIEQFVFEKTQKRDQVWVYEMKSELKQLTGVLTIIQIVLGIIAGISLLVGGIGIMNIMLVTVAERKKEIGIRKAIGASPAAIRNQFLAESVLLTVTGGLGGIISGLGLAALGVKFFPVQAKISLTLNMNGIFFAFFFSAAVGIFFGLNPAIRAAKLDPVKALTD